MGIPFLTEIMYYTETPGTYPCSVWGRNLKTSTDKKSARSENPLLFMGAVAVIDRRSCYVLRNAMTRWRNHVRPVIG